MRKYAISSTSFSLSIPEGIVEFGDVVEFSLVTGAIYLNYLYQTSLLLRLDVPSVLRCLSLYHNWTLCSNGCVRPLLVGH